MRSHIFKWMLMGLFLPASLYSFQNGFTGIWEFEDEDGDAFLVQVTEDHRVISTYAKGDNVVAPEEGYCHASGTELYILYNNGWMDVVRQEKGGYTKTAYAPGTAISKKGGKTTTAFKTGRQSLWGTVSEDDFTGYWKLLDENQKPFFLHLKADHSAHSTYADGSNGVFGENGTWRFEQNRVLVLYDSGWVDIIQKGQNGFSKYSYAPGQRIGGKPDNTSTVKRANMEEMAVKR